VEEEDGVLKEAEWQDYPQEGHSETEYSEEGNDEEAGYDKEADCEEAGYSEEGNDEEAGYDKEADCEEAGYGEEALESRDHSAE